MVRQIYDISVLSALLLLIHMARSSPGTLRQLKDWLWISDQELENMDSDD